MKNTTIIIIIFIFFSFQLNASEYGADMIIYGASNNINFYSFETEQNYTNLMNLGPTPNEIRRLGDYIVVINSGDLGANTNIQIFPLQSFYDYSQNGNLAQFQAASKQVMLSDNGNAWSAALFSDSMALVSLAQTGQFDVVNLNTGIKTETITSPADGGPQGMTEIDDHLAAAAMSDWSFAGTGTGASVAIINTDDLSLEAEIPVHLNCVDVERLNNGNLLALSWGSWFGADNYGTLHYINSATYSEIFNIQLPSAAKANYVVELSDNEVYVNAFDQNYNTVYGILNLNTQNYSEQSSGFFASEIRNYFGAGYYLVNEGAQTKIYDENFVLTESLPFAVSAAHVIIEEENYISAEVPVEEGWNLLSVPLLAEDMSATSLFPAASTGATGFNGVYFAADTLENGKGYWMKFPAPGTVSITGSKINGGIELSQGWNIIGPFDQEVAVSSISTEPAGIIESSFFGFNEGYFTADTLMAGKAFWVKSSSDGTLYPAGGNMINKIKSNQNVLSSLLFIDAAGRKGILEITAEKTFNELPPLPPAGVFDIRFRNNSSSISPEENYAVDIRGALYPVELILSGNPVNIFAEEKNNILNEGEKFVINKGNITVSSANIEILNEFRLYENYPNPFNPSTTIRYDISQKTRVTLEVYNLLGEKLATMVDEIKEPGYHTATFNGDNLSSGMYMYKITAGKFSATKKMLLVK